MFLSPGLFPLAGPKSLEDIMGSLEPAGAENPHCGERLVSLEDSIMNER